MITIVEMTTGIATSIKVPVMHPSVLSCLFVAVRMFLHADKEFKFGLMHPPFAGMPLT